MKAAVVPWLLCLSAALSWSRVVRPSDIGFFLSANFAMIPLQQPV